MLCVFVCLFDVHNPRPALPVDIVMGFDYAQFFREEEDYHDEQLERDYQEFFEVIRIHLIIVLLVTALCFIANFIISKYKNVDLNNEVSLFGWLLGFPQN